MSGDAQIGIFSNPGDKGIVEENLRIPLKEWGLSESDLKPDAQACFLVPVLLHPKSRGCINLASADPKEAPVICANYLSDPQGHDIKTMREILKSAERLVQQGPLSEILCSGADHSPDMEKQFKPGSDDYYEEFARRYGTTLYHPVATCSIGKVVDAELRVIGLQGLRVVDAAVMPEIPSGNTNAPSIMVGEKGAQLISESHCLNARIFSKL